MEKNRFITQQCTTHMCALKDKIKNTRSMIDWATCCLGMKMKEVLFMLTADRKNSEPPSRRWTTAIFINNKYKILNV